MKAKQSTHFVLSVGLAWLACMGVYDSGWAQAPTGGTNAGEVTVVSSKLVEERLAKARADLAVAVALEELNATNRPAGSAAQETVLRRSLLEMLVRLYEQQLDYVAELATAKSRRAELAHEAQSWTGFAEPRPYSILLTDSLHESIQLERLEMANGESALLLLAKLVDEHRASLKEAEEKLRQFNEQLEGDKSAATANRLAWPRELERLRSQAAAASMAMLEMERQIRQERLAASRVRLGLLRQQLVLASAGATLTDADMAAVNARLDADQRELEGELTRAQSRYGGAIRAFEAAKEALRQAQAKPDVDAALVVRLAEEFELRRAQVDTANAELTALRSMLQAGTLARTVWEVRYAAFRSPSAETIRLNKGRLEQFIRRVELWQTYYRQESEIVASQLARLEARLAGLDAASEIAPILRERLAALRERDHLLLRLVREVERGERQIQRLDEELREAAGNLPFLGRLRNAFSGTRSFLAGLWDLELFVAQDTIIVDGAPITGKRSITLGKVISAILILIVGYWLAGLVSRFAEPIFVKRFKIEANQANLIRRWLRVLLVFGLTIFALISVKIPLTVFAFAGGALAIGLGFGLQTLLKNFVSGIIILFERPFRVGDVLDVAGQRGTVSSVGIRSSVLQSWDGTEVLIPNSTLLETNVTNWTYSNRAVRFNLSVGVAYGSDTRRVVQVLGEIVDRHGQVEKDPKPQVLFTEFGESALNFELRFWVDVVKTNSAQIASDLRQMIAGTFAEHGIIIAFPQRDIHLDAARPVPVQIMAPADASKSDGETAKPSVPAGSAPEPPTEDKASLIAKRRPSTSAESKEAGLRA
jgi:small-conductance mechanosensitive channel